MNKFQLYFLNKDAMKCCIVMYSLLDEKEKSPALPGI